jgi:hypothetical protein
MGQAPRTIHGGNATGGQRAHNDGFWFCLRSVYRYSA